MKSIHKNLLTILLSVIALVIIGTLVWFFFFFRPNTINNNQLNDALGENGDTVGGQLFPTSQPIDPSGQTPPGTDPNISIPKLRQISLVPTAGATAFNRQREETRKLDDAGKEESVLVDETVFRYIERGTGHLYETTGSNLTQNRLSNITFPQVHDAIFSPSGNEVLLQQLDPTSNFVRTYLADLVKNTENATSTPELAPIDTMLDGKYIDPAIEQLAANGNTFTYILRKDSGGSTVFESSFSSQTSNSVYTSEISEWLLQKPNSSHLVLTTKPSATAVGYSYLLNTNTGGLNKIISDIVGLTTLVDPTLKYAIYSDTGTERLGLFSKNLASGSVTKTSINTLPEKCVWSKKEVGIVYCGAPSFVPNSVFPEAWYQGFVSFDDSLWKIDIKTNTAEFIFSSNELAEDRLDITKPILSPDEDFLLFINKNDLTLWVMDLRS